MFLDEIQRIKLIFKRDKSPSWQENDTFTLTIFRINCTYVVTKFHSLICVLDCLKT